MAVPPARSNGRHLIAQRGLPQASCWMSWGEKAEGPSLPCTPSEAPLGLSPQPGQPPPISRSLLSPGPGPSLFLLLYPHLQLNLTFLFVLTLTELPFVTKVWVRGQGLRTPPGHASSPGDPAISISRRRSPLGESCLVPGVPSVSLVRDQEVATGKRDQRWALLGNTVGRLHLYFAVFSGGIRHSLNIIHLSFL